MSSMSDCKGQRRCKQRRICSPKGYIANAQSAALWPLVMSLHPSLQYSHEMVVVVAYLDDDT